MRPLNEFPIKERRAVRGVLCDIDDTLTTSGRLTAAAFSAMDRLQKAGLMVVPVTGRPAGWCDHIARMWPVSAVVGENGAFYFRYDPAARKMLRRYVHDATMRAAQREQLQQIGASIVAGVPGAAVAADQLYRETDLAIDYCEDVARLPRESVDRIVAIMETHGLTAKVSSIHVNGWFGDYDKLAMTRRLFAERFALDLGAANHDVVFAGDSPNDAPMFAFFERSVGVANVRRFDNLLPDKPKFITRAVSGAGFVELADHLLGS